MAFFLLGGIGSSSALALDLIAYLRDIVGFFPDFRIKVSMAIKWDNLFAGGGSWLRFIKKPTAPVKYDKTKRNKMRHAGIRMPVITLRHTWPRQDTCPIATALTNDTCEVPFAI